jgi:hypothetical protein
MPHDLSHRERLSGEGQINVAFVRDDPDVPGGSDLHNPVEACGVNQRS